MKKIDYITIHSITSIFPCESKKKKSKLFLLTTTGHCFNSCWYSIDVEKLQLYLQSKAWSESLKIK